MRRCFVALAVAMVLPWPAVAAEVIVRPGETLSELAERHGVSVERLLKVNGITDANHVEAGRRLLLPAATSAASSRSRPTSGSGRGAAAGGSVVVQPGETLSEIAEREGVSLTTLMQLNGISKPDAVQAGSRLVLGGASSTPSSSGRPSPGRRSAVPGGVVVVRPGDTLSDIAQREGISLATLMQLNGISQADALQVGTRLVLGNSRGPTGSSASNSKVGTSSFPSNATTHEVRTGESLSVIAEGYGLPMSRLMALNNISDPDKVNVGTKLQLRGSVPSTPRPPRSAAAPTRPANAVATAPSKPAPKPSAKPAATQAPANSSAAPTAAHGHRDATTARGGGSNSSSAGSAVAMASARPASTASAGGAVSSPASTRPATSASRPTPATANASPTTVATATVSSQPAQASPTPAKPDWRTYGPLQVDWANWQPMGGSLVAPTLNADGRSLYLAINCGARKLNATTQAGQWKSWDDPQTDFETQLVSDLCKSRS
ncbi:MAG: LysM peptidoglycan-binding domain-containing protein [Cyanobium sp.]|jgi:LysM repeat protein